MSDLPAVQLSWLIPLFPLIGAIIAGFFGARWLKQHSHWPIWIGAFASAALALALLFGMADITRKSDAKGGHRDEAKENLVHPDESLTAPFTATKKWFDWIVVGDFKGQHAPGYPGPIDVSKADGVHHGLAPFYVQAGAWIDPLTAVMLAVVTGIGFLITVFSAGYMKGEEGYFRFFAYLGLFLFSMTCLVLGNNFVMLYLGWEGVGLCSYLLIGYYYEKPAAREAAKKAFIVNRVGDLGFALGILLIYLAFGTVSYFGTGADSYTGVLELATLKGGMTGFQLHALHWIPFLLMLGAFGKSAQFPLYVWLPDAMEGPTPVSALIHAATMVTAGVYMIARCGSLFVGNQAAMVTVAVVGAFTALFAASIALRQFDLKKVFAYSTVSQLGFMFVGLGCLAPVAGVFHLVTHAFFKALLFLSCGVIMHAMSGELDMRKFSGLKRVLPKTRWLMLIGCLSLSGAPLLGSGFYSKDEIVAAAWHHSTLLGAVMLFTAFLTAYYTFRLYFQVFEGPEILPNGPAPAHASGSTDIVSASHSAVATHTAASSGVDVGQAHGAGHHDHEPSVMIWPLVVLAIGAFFAGYLNWPSEKLGEFLHESPSFTLAQTVAESTYGAAAINATSFGGEQADEAIAATQRTHARYMMLFSGLVALAGIGLAYQMHLKDRAAAERVAEKLPRITRLLEGRYWVDEIYEAAIVHPLRWAGRAFYFIDRILVDGVVWMVGFVPQASGFALKLTTQRGYLQGYAATMLFGIAVILFVVFW